MDYILYDSQGEKYGEVSVENGIEKGSYSSYGFVVEEWVKKDGLLQKYVNYSGPNKIRDIEFYSNGNMIKQIYYGDNGQIKHVFEYNEDGSDKFD